MLLDEQRRWQMVHSTTDNQCLVELPTDCPVVAYDFTLENTNISGKLQVRYMPTNSRLPHITLDVADATGTAADVPGVLCHGMCLCQACIGLGLGDRGMS